MLISMNFLRRIPALEYVEATSSHSANLYVDWMYLYEGVDISVSHIEVRHSPGYTAILWVEAHPDVFEVEDGSTDSTVFEVGRVEEIGLRNAVTQLIQRHGDDIYIQTGHLTHQQFRDQVETDWQGVRVMDRYVPLSTGFKARKGKVL